jgi:hypothetical protein
MCVTWCFHKKKVTSNTGNETETYMQGISRVIMSPTALKMQPTIHCQKKPDIKIKIIGFF